MASPSSKLLLLRRLSRALKPSSSSSSSMIRKSCIRYSTHLLEASNCAHRPPLSPPSRSFCSRSPTLDGGEGPATIDYRSLLQEDEFHNLADSTIHDLLEKLEEYGDSIDIDGFDIDYGNQVLTLKLGTLGTYVVNKQTPNRQIWMSSPVRNILLLQHVFHIWKPNTNLETEDSQRWVTACEPTVESNLVSGLSSDLFSCFCT
ncbi:frataxin, mitochondrial-like isoform X4 [Actinidia eriantha]|uniref:frataxin, mitochondrial-like isoform X4 n=1 Tax=Actinidia eriantha TaxID=165200 RepID=UPI0025841F06|nr:frataxin, mitochondrial-like isoform X4 [Actinidia eriantha]